MTGTQEILWNSFTETLIITFWIFILMIGIELLVLKYKNSLNLLRTKNNFISYLISCFSGYIPGCVGMFAMDSLYMAGFLSFGALTATMITSIGDEIVVLFSLVIKGLISLKILTILLFTLFVLGITGGFLADWLVKKFKIKQCEKCHIEIHESYFSPHPPETHLADIHLDIRHANHHEFFTRFSCKLQTRRITKILPDHHCRTYWINTYFRTGHYFFYAIC